MPVITKARRKPSIKLMHILVILKVRDHLIFLQIICLYQEMNLLVMLVFNRWGGVFERKDGDHFEMQDL